MGSLVLGKRIFGSSNAGSRAADASSEFNQRAIDELRRQFDVTQGNLGPFIEAGTGALPGVIQGSTAGGLDERLAEIFDTDIFGSLVEERQRGVQGQLAAGGLTRSGTAIQEAANVPTSLGLMLEQLLTGRATNLAGSGQNAATGLGAIGAQTSGGIANRFARQGQDAASGILTDQQAEAQQTQQLLTTAATAAAIFFSDPALKENVEPISTIGDLTLFQWDWIPETKGTMIEGCADMGFMADEVKEKYPEHVTEFCGLMVIDYPSLLSEMEARQCPH